MDGYDSKHITCMICQREFEVIREQRRRPFRGMCPYCHTWDNGTGNGRLETEAERFYDINRTLENEQ